MATKDTSVIILTYNAPEYVRETIESINQVTDKEDLQRMEIIVWDNASGPETREVLNELVEKGYIDKCFFSDKNLLFAGGNNACVKQASAKSRYYLLLNSDVKIVNPKWFSTLIKKKESGNYAVAAYGACYNPNRADGYCYLIDKELYDSYPLDENFQWFWSITKQQAKIRETGKSIFAYLNHDKALIHKGGIGEGLCERQGNGY